jgi:prophage regulatory protein
MCPDHNKRIVLAASCPSNTSARLGTREIWLRIQRDHSATSTLQSLTGTYREIAMQQPSALPLEAQDQASSVFLRMPSVTQMTGLGRSTIYRLMAQQQFPCPVRLGVRAVAWRRSELDVWSQTRRRLRIDEERLSLGIHRVCRDPRTSPKVVHRGRRNRSLSGFNAAGADGGCCQADSRRLPRSGSSVWRCVLAREAAVRGTAVI